LDGIYGKEVLLADGRRVLRDDEYIRESILRPATHIVNGYPQIMPTFQGQISEVGVLQLISYIKSLGDSETPADASEGQVTAGGVGTEE
jgi:cytochrome c oxidase subunit 2